MSSLSTMEQIKDAVVSGIQSLNLPGIDAASVIKVKVLSDRKDEFPKLPGVIVANYGNKAAILNQGVTSRDDIPYQVIVAVLQAGNQDQTQYADRMEFWTERISSKFRFQALSQVSTVYYCEPVTDVNFDSGAFFKNLDAGILIFRFISRETRG